MVVVVVRVVVGRGVGASHSNTQQAWRADGCNGGCGVPCRNSYIATLKKVAEKFKDRPFSYLWAQGGAQPELEGSVGVGGFGKHWGKGVEQGW